MSLFFRDASVISSLSGNRPSTGRFIDSPYPHCATTFCLAIWPQFLWNSVALSVVRLDFDLGEDDPRFQLGVCAR